MTRGFRLAASSNLSFSDPAHPDGRPATLSIRDGRLAHQAWARRLHARIPNVKVQHLVIWVRELLARPGLPVSVLVLLQEARHARCAFILANRVQPLLLLGAFAFGVKRSGACASSRRATSGGKGR